MPGAAAQDSGGFQVSPSSLHSEAGALRATGDDLAAASADLRRLPAASAEAFGDPTAAAAYVGLLANYELECSVQVGATHELADRLLATSVRYEWVDQQNVASVMDGVFEPLGVISTGIQGSGPVASSFPGTHG